MDMVTIESKCPLRMIYLAFLICEKTGELSKKVVKRTRVDRHFPIEKTSQFNKMLNKAV